MMISYLVENSKSGKSKETKANINNSDSSSSSTPDSEEMLDKVADSQSDLDYEIRIAEEKLRLLKAKQNEGNE
jgi:hypothetical protein